MSQAFTGLVNTLVNETFHLHLVNESMLCVPLTIVCCVQSNVYGLGNIHCIRYHTRVDSFLSTLPPLQRYPHITSGSV